MNNRIKFLIVAYLVGLFKLTSVIQGQKSPPNVILIYTDDHGYTDLGVLGIDKNVNTPNMDKLARGGALMTAGYSTAPQCVPSRAGLMIGRVQNEFAFPHNGCDAGDPYEHDDLGARVQWDPESHARRCYAPGRSDESGSRLGPERPHAGRYDPEQRQLPDLRGG